MKSGLLKVENTSKYEMKPYTYTILIYRKKKSTASGTLNVIPNYNVIPPKVFLYIYAKSLHSCPTLCDPMDHSQFIYPWDSPGKNTGVICRFLLQEFFLAQGLNPHLLHPLH